ncbi:MAG: hypothetical protein M0Z47_12920 [Actinomycetota bacterium]|nr:hypothetical protein [Actinomycetota bacterium]
MKTVAALGLILVVLGLLVLAIAGFSPAKYVLVVVVVFSILFNFGPARRKRAG